jgi:hypothetical protein
MLPEKYCFDIEKSGVLDLLFEVHITLGCKSEVSTFILYHSENKLDLVF